MGLLAAIPDFIHTIHEHQQDAAVNDVMKQNNFMTDPQGTINALYKIAPDKALQLQGAYQQGQKAQSDANMSKFAALSQMQRAGWEHAQQTGQPYDVGAAIDSATPFYSAPLSQGGLGWSPQQIATYRATIAANPSLLRGMDPDYQKTEDENDKNYTLEPGAHRFDGTNNQDLAHVAPNMQSVEVPEGGSVSNFDPSTGRYNSAGPGSAAPGAPMPGNGGPVTYGQWSGARKQQESGGDYTALNRSTGARGAWQVMDATGQRLAGKLGLAWRPDLMTSNTPQGIKYQDAIGNAAGQESWDAAGGDPTKASIHYYGGPATLTAFNRDDPATFAANNPKTAAYAHQMAGRLGSPGPATAPSGQPGAPTPQAATPAQGTTSVQGNPKPDKPGKGPMRTLTPQEVANAGFPAGAVVQEDGNGGYKVVSKPSATQQQSESALDGTYQGTIDGIHQMRQQLADLKNDPDLNSNLGWEGRLKGAIGTPTHRSLQGQIQQIQTGKLVTLLNNMKANGNPMGNRILKVEVEQLPKLLGNFDLTQDPDHFHAQIDSAQAQLDHMENQATANYNAHKQSGVYGAQAPQSGSTIKAGMSQGGYTFTGGDPSNKANWRKN